MARLLRLSPLVALSLIVGCGGGPNPAERLVGMPAGTGFILRESNGVAGKHKYTIFIPRKFNAANKYPTIVFLHGVGEAGSDGIGCTTVGIGPAIADRNGEFPFIVIFPQTGFDWTSTDSENIMLDALKDAQAAYPAIDGTRISLSGMSSGGRGVWVLGARHPEIFAALVPMGGYSATGEVPRLTKMPVYALHNSDDWVVGVDNTREMVRLLKEAGGKPIEKIYENSGNGHNCWDQAYAEGELFRWLQATTKGGSAAVPVSTGAGAGAGR